MAGRDVAGLVCVLLTSKTISLSYAGRFPGPPLSGALASLTALEFRCRAGQRQANPQVAASPLSLLCRWLAVNPLMSEANLLPTPKIIVMQNKTLIPEMASFQEFDHGNRESN